MSRAKLAVAIGVLCACGSRRYAEVAVVDKTELALAARPLSATESKVIADHGFAILEHAEARSFHLGYTSIFHAHEPVYVTADSLLHAWHESYDGILMAIERGVLIEQLSALLDDLTRGAARVADAQTRADLELYLDVAKSLASGRAIGTADAKSIVARAEAAAGPSELTLFGTSDAFDFSMLKPRGHYTFLPELERYFRATAWLGRAELRIAKKQSGRPWAVNRRALRAALALGSLMTGDALARWRTIDSIIGSFVGPQDSLSVPGLTTASAALGGNVDARTDAEIVAAFEHPAAQKIRTQMLFAGDETIAALLLGQRYVADSRVLSDLTHGTLASDPPRMMPSPLDVAAATFHNASARTLLEPEMKRYGDPYVAALDAASKRDLDQDSLHHLWLGALRGLSPDGERDANLPAPLHGDAWGRRMLGTQLASWAELRHDDILYAKQSITAMILCGYPHAYVDPYPAFYDAMERIADKGGAIVAGAPALGAMAPTLGKYFAGMKRTMTRLHAMATREQQGQPMTDDDLDFLNHMVSVDGRSGGCGGPVLEATGWYADLYFDRSKALYHDPIIADVHTQPTDEDGNPVGRVLHVATGRPRMLVVTLEHDHGEHATTYRGFVSTYVEKVTGDFKRYTDEEWRAELASHPAGVIPWMRDIVAP